MSVRILLSELKRRQVYRAVLVYATVAWVLLEAADVVFPRLGFEDWTVNLVLYLAIIGLPIAIVLAWVFDVTPEGITRTPPLSPGTQHHFSWARISEFVVIGVLVVMVGYLYTDRLSLQERLLQRETLPTEVSAESQAEAPDPTQYRSIAVLPFADMSETRDQEWFAEGIAEELLHALASVKDLRVMARTSSFAFKGTDKTIAEIAETLGVQAVLEGSVRRFGDRVRITAQLIDANSGYHIWSGSYERQLTDIFQLQDALARSIVQTLRLELGVERTRPLVAEQTTIPEAYNAFIRGRADFDFASPQDLSQGIRFFEIAVEADPLYAEAWGYLALARSYTALWRSTNDVSTAVTMAYEEALRLDPNQSEALTAKAWMTQLVQRDWKNAGLLYQQAVAARATSYLAKLTYSIFYLAGIDEIPHAIKLLSAVERADPFHAGYKSNLAMLHLWGGDAPAAIEKAQESLALNPLHMFALMALIEANTANGDFSAALSVVESLPEPLQQEARIGGRAAVVYALQGDKDRSREIHERILKTTPDYYANMQATVTALSLGEVEEALDILESEVDKYAWTTVFIRTYFRRNESINQQPRYLALLERMGLDDKSVAELHNSMSFD